jgi:hypothetical protein
LAKDYSGLFYEVPTAFDAFLPHRISCCLKRRISFITHDRSFGQQGYAILIVNTNRAQGWRYDRSFAAFTRRRNHYLRCSVAGGLSKTKEVKGFPSQASCGFARNVLIMIE